MEELNDTQSESDDRGIDINWVGVSSFKFPISIEDKSEVQSTVADFKLAVDLPNNQRGTHMSRFIEVLNGYDKTICIKSIKGLNEILVKKLESTDSKISIKFPYFILKDAPQTGSKGIVNYGVNLVSTLENGSYELISTVSVPITTLCPCSKAISDRGAHNQRGSVKFSVKSSNFIWLEDMITLVETSASSELYSVLKRPDEKLVTERAYDNPVFVEDLVRNVAIKANQLQEITWYKIEAENFESIHNHNAYAVVENSIENS